MTVLTVDVEPAGAVFIVVFLVVVIVAAIVQHRAENRSNRDG